MTIAKKAEATEAQDPLFGEAGITKFDYVKFDNVGDKVKGTYVVKTETISAKYGYTQANYYLTLDSGATVIVGGRNPDKTTSVRVIYGMDKIPMGAVIGFIFSGTKETNKGNPAKLIDLRYAGEKNLAAYEAFKSKFNFGATTELPLETVSEAEATEEEPEF
jgi:hypothetical protein